MEQLTDLKAILHSKRANIYYLEKCRVIQKDGRVLYLSEAKNENQYWNIPIANTTCLLLGPGTSVTQAAMRMVDAFADHIGDKTWQIVITQARLLGVKNCCAKQPTKIRR